MSRLKPVAVSGLGCALMILAACGNPKLASKAFENLSPLGEELPADTTFSAEFDCAINRPENLTRLSEHRVPVGPTDLVRNPRRTLDSNLLTKIESARIVEREFETWVALPSLIQFRLPGGAGAGRVGVDEMSRNELFEEIRDRDSPRASRRRGDRSIHSDFARARVVEYRYRGTLLFRIPASLAIHMKETRERAGVSAQSELPFIFSSPELPGEGVLFRIEGNIQGAHLKNTYRVYLETGPCRRFIDPRLRSMPFSYHDDP